MLVLLSLLLVNNPPVWIDAIQVGLHPVSIRVRPGIRDVWVANHVSDSMSLIGLDRRLNMPFSSDRRVRWCCLHGCGPSDVQLGHLRCMSYRSRGREYGQLSRSSPGPVRLRATLTYFVRDHFFFEYLVRRLSRVVI